MATKLQKVSKQGITIRGVQIPHHFFSFGKPGRQFARYPETSGTHIDPADYDAILREHGQWAGAKSRPEPRVRPPSKSKLPQKPTVPPESRVSRTQEATQKMIEDPSAKFTIDGIDIRTMSPDDREILRRSLMDKIGSAANRKQALLDEDVRSGAQFIRLGHEHDRAVRSLLKLRESGLIDD